MLVIAVSIAVYAAGWFATTTAITVLSAIFDIEQRWRRGVRPLTAGLLWPLLTIGAVQAGVIVLLATAVSSRTPAEAARLRTTTRDDDSLAVLVPIRGGL